MKNKNYSSDKVSGIIYVISAFTIWGLLPLYWKTLSCIPADEILAHRIFWSFIFVFSVLLLKNRFDDFKRIFKKPKDVIYIVICSIVISINWFVYIWAVNSNHVVEASLGYYINPLIVVFLAVVVLKEKLNKFQLISLALASIGVIILTVQYGRVPWIALVLGFSFALYGLIKKLIQVDALVGLALETMVIMPVAFGYIIFKQISHTGAIGNIPLITTITLFCAGIATATPLFLFAEGTKRVSLSTVGFSQYISPTLNLILGVFIYKEEFSIMHFISFSFIWGGLIVYTISQFVSVSKKRTLNKKKITT